VSSRRVFFLFWGIDSRGFNSPRKLPPQLANRPEQLVPIRLEFDVEHHKMRETFVWNLNGGSFA
jgi:SWI/SNF-related matrix-associated actin-dependent regulator of chromatin subfamily B protein 1